MAIFPKSLRALTIIGITLLIAVCFILLKLNQNMQNNDPNIIRYVALGDSYTIGEGASYATSWPSVLTSHLNQQGVDITLVANPSVTGYTTQDLIEHELEVFKISKPTFATLQIGVNDWVRGVTISEYRKNLGIILDQMQTVLIDKNNLVVITIPDFSITPQGKLYSQGRDIPEGLQEFNQIIKNESRKRGLTVVDIFPISQQAKNNPEHISSDGLHPSALGYLEWEKVIIPHVLKVLRF